MPAGLLGQSFQLTGTIKSLGRDQRPPQAPPGLHLKAAAAGQLGQLQQVVLDAFLPVPLTLAGDEQTAEGGLIHTPKLPCLRTIIKPLSPRTMG